MSGTGDSDWFASRTAGAPEALRDRATACFDATTGALPVRLETAARAALDSALAAGVGRPAALDLLAADALVTLALLAHAESDPESLADHARAMRRGTGAAA